jgi:hypothetical protein
MLMDSKAWVLRLNASHLESDVPVTTLRPEIIAMLN